MTRRPAATVRLVGIDEAGLGPLLGPLAVAAVCLDTSGHGGHGRPRGLGGLFRFSPGDLPPAGERLLVADSKHVFHLPDGAARAEESVLAWLVGADPPTALPTLPSLRAWIAEHDPEGAASLEDHPWYGELGARPPVFAPPERAAAAVARVHWMRVMGALPRWPRPLVRLVDETRFNEGVARHGNKAEWVWVHVADLLRRALAPPAPERFQVVVDRLGGRRFYEPRLCELFADGAVAKHQETRGGSVYRIALADGRTGTIAFRVRAEHASFPVALASLCAKYLREAAMASFNAWFAQHAPHVRPTKGYVTDARRWLAEMRPTLERLALAREHLQRTR